jgi:hypothetical protein
MGSLEKMLATQEQIDAVLSLLEKSEEIDLTSSVTFTQILIALPRIVEFVERTLDAPGSQKLELALAICNGIIIKLNKQLDEVVLEEDEIELLKISIAAIIRASRGEFDLNRRSQRVLRLLKRLLTLCHASS